MTMTQNPRAVTSPDELFTSNLDVARRCREHPFLVGIADGTLGREAFCRYVAQDAVFLDAFVRAYALCVAKAPDRESMTAFRTLLEGGCDELDLHQGYAERWQVDLSPEPAPATSAYTDFLLRVAALEPVGHVCAAMVPCMRLYAWLGSELQPVTVPESPYREWVDTYASPEFHDLAATLEGLLTRLGGAPDVIADHYRRAMVLELEFFAAVHLDPTAS